MAKYEVTIHFTDKSTTTLSGEDFTTTETGITLLHSDKKTTTVFFKNVDMFTAEEL